MLIIAALVYTYGLRIAVGDSSPFDYFGYFTNQTSLLAGIIMIVTGSLTLARRTSPPVLGLLRGIATAYLLVVAVIYNLLVPGTGSAPPWVSFLLHVLFPLYVALDWLLVNDRPRLRWRSLWALFPYPAVWLGVVLFRGATDGWVPYGFLLPERGAASLIAHIIGLVLAVAVAGSLVWGMSRFRVMAGSATRAT
ncbi:Pr6Pr family membrane protein [Microbacterium aerolatum]|uniref:Pr6Pr family membrane protein n=1 Tax=Microbacterium aerolatum TaxID=153731 RepID=UPI00384DC9B3